jgi:LysM repeat protein
MAGRSRARYLAPIALFAALAATYLVVHSGLNPKSPTPTTDGPVSHLTTQQGTHRHTTHTARIYIVKPGDNLTAIAVKTGVPVGTIEALNAGLDPNSLQAGQRLRLRR